jgi:hypothetical protein
LQAPETGHSNSGFAVVCRSIKIGCPCGKCNQFGVHPFLDVHQPAPWACVIEKAKGNLLGTPEAAWLLTQRISSIKKSKANNPGLSFALKVWRTDESRTEQQLLGMKKLVLDD